MYSLLATTEIILCCQVRTHVHCRYTKGKAVAYNLVNNLKGLGMIHTFHFFRSKNRKTSSKKPGHDDQISKKKLLQYKSR